MNKFKISHQLLLPHQLSLVAIFILRENCKGVGSGVRKRIGKKRKKRKEKKTFELGFDDSFLDPMVLLQPPID